MAQILKFVDGFPESVASSAYDESIYYSSGLAADTTITLPNSGTFFAADGADVFIVLNKRVLEVTLDFTVVGAGPSYTQIKNVYALPDDSVLNFKQQVT